MAENFENKDIKQKTNEEKKKNSRIKYLINILLVLVITVVAIIISMSSNYQEVFKQLGNSDWRWVLVIVAIMIGITLIRTFVLFCFARLYTRDYHFPQALAVEEIGNFYSGITPGATGGQFMEAYIFKKQGIHVSSAVSMLAMYSILYQVALIVYGLVSFIVKYDFIMGLEAIPFNIGGWSFSIPMWPLTIIGFGLNVGVIAILLLMSYWKGFHNFISGPCIGLLNKMHIIKNPDKSRDSLRISVENFKLELRRLLTNIPFTILVLVFFFIYFTFLFSLPFFTGLALHNQTPPSMQLFWDSIFLSNYHQMVTGLIPLPGAAGISEYFFVKVFVNFNDPATGFFYIAGATLKETQELSSSLCSAALLIWRTFSFTLPLLISGIFTAFYRATPKDIDKNEDMPSRETFTEMKRETLSTRQDALNETLHSGTLSRDAIMKRLRALNFKEKNKQTEKSKKKTVDDDGFVDIDTKDDDE